jgi:hypothetical protein
MATNKKIPNVFERFDTGSAVFTRAWYNFFSNTPNYEDVSVVIKGSLPPTTKPNKVGDMFIDTNLQKVYIATGTSSSSDWTLIN